MWAVGKWIWELPLWQKPSLKLFKEHLLYQGNFSLHFCRAVLVSLCVRSKPCRKYPQQHPCVNKRRVKRLPVWAVTPDVKRNTGVNIHIKPHMTKLNVPLHYSRYRQRAEFTNPCLIQCLINSLSSCVCSSEEERGYTVCKERGSVFEVVFCKSLEDDQARGWTQAVGREATSTYPLRGQKLGLAMAVFATRNYHCYLFIWNNISH